MTSWPKIPLGDLMVKRRGSVNPAQFEEETFDLYSIPAYDRGHPEITKGRNIGSAKQLVMPGDVLLSRIVPHIRRAWVVDGAQANRKIASGEWIVFQSESVIPSYLRYFLMSDTFHIQFMRTVSGVGGSLLRARASETARITISVPPLAEQERIVALLDEADALRKLRAQANHRTADLIPALFHDMFGDPSTNPMGWPEVTVGAVASIKAGFAWKSEYYSDDESEGPSVIRIQNLGGNENAQTVYYKGEIVPGYWIEPEEILVSLSGSFKAYRWQGQPALLNQRIVVIRPGKQIGSDFIFSCILARLASIQRQAMGIAVANASMSTVRDVIIPLPPIELQESFAMKVQFAHRLFLSQGVARRTNESLSQSLLKRAFSKNL